MSNDALTHPSDAPGIGPALAEAATTAGSAPSIHDTQPRRWRLTGRTQVVRLPAEQIIEPR